MSKVELTTRQRSSTTVNLQISMIFQKERMSMDKFLEAAQLVANRLGHTFIPGGWDRQPTRWQTTCAVCGAMLQVDTRHELSGAASVQACQNDLADQAWLALTFADKGKTHFVSEDQAPSQRLPLAGWTIVQVLGVRQPKEGDA